MALRKSEVATFIRTILVQLHTWKEDTYGNIIAPNRIHRFHFSRGKWHYQHKVPFIGWKDRDSGYYGKFDRDEFALKAERWIADGRLGQDS